MQILVVSDFLCKFAEKFNIIIMNFIGDTLRKLRTTRKKSQQEIADFVCIDRKTHTRIGKAIRQM